MTDRGKELVVGLVTGLLFWVVVLGTAAMALQRACAQ